MAVLPGRVGDDHVTAGNTVPDTPAGVLHCCGCWLPERCRARAGIHTDFSFWMKSLTSGCVQVSPWYQKSSRASLLRATHAITCGDIWRVTRTGKLLAATVGASAIVTE